MHTSKCYCLFVYLALFLTMRDMIEDIHTNCVECVHACIVGR